MNRFIVILLAIVFSVSCVPDSFAADAPSKNNEPDGGSVAAAVVSNFIYVPGKVVTCVTTAALWTVGMTLTLGYMYKGAGQLVHFGCAEKWFITGEDFADK